MCESAARVKEIFHASIHAMRIQREREEGYTTAEPERGKSNAGTRLERSLGRRERGGVRLSFYAEGSLLGRAAGVGPYVNITTNSACGVKR